MIDPYSAHPLAGSRRRGTELKRAIFAGGEMLTAYEVARRLGVDPSHVGQMVADGRLFGLRHPDNPDEMGYPGWQLECKVRTLLPPLLERLKELDTWDVWYFMTSSAPSLGQLTPLEVMRGETTRPEDFARLHDVLADRTKGVALSEAAQRFLDGVP